MKRAQKAFEHCAHIQQVADVAVMLLFVELFSNIELSILEHVYDFFRQPISNFYYFVLFKAAVYIKYVDFSQKWWQLIV